MKIFLKIILLFSSFILVHLDEDNDILIVGNNYCITNGSSAIIFNKDVDNSNEDISVSYIYPASSTTKFDCDFENDGRCGNLNLWINDWSIQNSYYTPQPEIITDRRWEKFHIRKTSGYLYRGLKYTEVISDIQSDIDIPISIRIKKEAHIYLCDGDGDPVNSNCYWIMLGSDGGTMSKIRKCKNGQISNRNGVYPTESICRQGLNNTSVNPLNENEWKHFLIQKYEGLLRIRHNNKIFLQILDKNWYSIKKMFIHSKVVDGLWKIHYHKFLESDTRTEFQLPSGPKFKPSNEEFCISLFVKTSHVSQIRVKVKLNRQDFLTSTITTQGKWIEYKIYERNVQQNSEYDVYFVKTFPFGVDTSNINDAYWAIDDVRQCNIEEYRYITSDSNANCQQISSSRPRILEFKQQNEISNNGINCSQDSFGSNCIPCQLLGNQYCPAFKYCEENSGFCYCTAGYTDTFCNKECTAGSFGHGCSYKSYCLNKNNPVTGACSICQTPFTGPSCNITNSPFFIKEPIVFDIELTSFKIQQTDLENRGNGNYYYFEYSKTDGSSNDWISINDLIPISQSPVVSFDNAEADTEYQIRAIVTVSDRKPKTNDEKFSQSTIKFYTSCNHITNDNIIIQPNNVSATITLQLQAESCKAFKYCYIVNNLRCTKISSLVFDTPPVLKPYTKYNITFKYFIGDKINDEFEINKEFDTTEGEPSAIPEITNMITSNTIKLIWQEPKEKNSEIVKYEIKYKLFKYIACDTDNETEFFIQNIPETELTIENLTSYSCFKMQIRAFNNLFKGQLKEFEICTDPTEELSENERITIENITSFSSGFYLRVSQIPCQYITGPISFQSEVMCITPRCYGLNHIYTVNYTNIKDTYLKFSHLDPYTEYNLTVWISRNTINGTYSDFKSFQTEPDVPNTISMFKVYTKTQNSISLRWLPPDPPTGILKGYHISYTYRYYSVYGPVAMNFNAIDAKCKMWSEFHCVTITKYVNAAYIYNIIISAKNEKPDDYGKESKVLEVNNIDEGPEEPYGVKYNWTDSNELFIYWFHPNNTNGLLKSFELWISNSEIYYYHLESEDAYKLQYQYQLIRQYASCQSFQLFLGAHNIHSRSGYNKINIEIPPNIPPIIPKSSITHTSTNYTITLNIDFQIMVQTLYILICKHDKTEDLIIFENNLLEDSNVTTNLTTARIVYEATNLNSSITFEIGNENITSKNWSNTILESGTNYSINMFLINRCNHMSRVRRAQKYMITQGNPHLSDDMEIIIEEGDEMGDGGMWALIFLLIIPIALFGVWYAKKKNVDINKIIRPPTRNQEGDQLPLTEKPPVANPRVNVVKPKPTIVLPALQTKHSRKIPIIEFENYVKESIETGELEKQHNLFPKGLLKPHNIGSAPDNKNKNRYKNLIAYDHTRVKLKGSFKDDNNVGYINANYIDGYRKPRSYIATQGPKVNTLNDFWLMVWQENVNDIVMLANIYENGKKKVDKYWPDINEEKTYGFIKVQYVSETVFANFVLRVFTVQYKTHERKVNQMHYTTWPDHGVPLYSQSLVPFLQRLLKIPHNSQTPILVHCSAGVGRTGTIILSDICLRMAAGEGFLDFLAHLENLRNQRSNMVDNIEQYKLAHLVVLECLFGMRTSIPCTDEMQSIVEVTLNNNGIKTQMKYILETQWQDMAMETMLENDEVAPVYHEKNRVKDIIPDNYRVYITRYPHDDEKSSYINAVMVDDFSNPGRYIVTQQPLPNTIGDFWRLILERSCSVIISLNTINLDDKTVCKIWPEKEEELDPVDFIKIVHKKTQRLNFYKVITVQLVVKQNKSSTLTDGNMEVNIIALDNWRSEDLLPNSIEEFLAFRDAADAIARTSEHVVVTCYDGAKACGLYLAMSFLIEQMKLEQECDVCLAVRSIRHSRKQFVTTEEQYEFLYRAAVTFISGFQPYSNFS